jgi:glycosyltransferase involved in cell wall biosynthesis
MRPWPAAGIRAPCCDRSYSAPRLGFAVALPRMRAMSRGTPMWLADWSESEEADFRWAWDRAGIETRVLRSRPLGPTVGTRAHRLRSWPAYLSLALRGLHHAGDGAIVAWQPLVGAVAGMLRRRSAPRIVVLSPILVERARTSALQRVALKGYARCDRLLFYTRHGLETAAELGLSRSALRFVPLGVRPRRDEPLPPGDYLLAVGRDSRDWATLAEAAEGLEMDVVVIGPASLPEGAQLRLQPQVSGDAFFALLDGAAAIVLPFARTDRPIGHLSMLAAMSVGRPVVATQSPGVEDYISEDIGSVVPPRDPRALRDALQELSDPTLAAEKGRAALIAARTAFSLERFVREVDFEARGERRDS